MNLNRYDLSHFKICLHSIIVMAIAAICFSSQAQADGVILIKNHATQSPQFWRAFPFSKNEASSYNYTVTLLNGQQQNFFRTEVGAIFEEPKWNELIITSDADWQKLEQQKSKFLDSLGQFPQLKNWSDSLAVKFDNLLDKNSSAVVIYKGRIISRDDYNKLRGLNSPSNSGKLEMGELAELTIGSVKLTNVKLTSFSETRVSLVHSNGIQGYNVADLKESEISSLGKAFPEFAEHVKKLLAAATDKVASSNEPTKDDKFKSSSTPLRQASEAAQMKKLIAVLSKEINKEFNLEIPISETAFPTDLYQKVEDYIDEHNLHLMDPKPGSNSQNGDLVLLYFSVKGKLSKTRFSNLYEAPVAASIDSTPSAVYEILELPRRKTAVIRVLGIDSPNELEARQVYKAYYHFEFTEELDMDSGFAKDIRFYRAPDVTQEQIIRNLNLKKKLEELKKRHDSLSKPY